MSVELREGILRRVMLLLREFGFHVCDAMIAQASLAMTAMEFQIRAGSRIADERTPHLLAGARMPGKGKAFRRFRMAGHAYRVGRIPPTALLVPIHLRFADRVKH